MKNNEIINQFTDLIFGYIDVDEYCENFNADHFAVLLKANEFPFSNRAALCDFLDISESTLSGWIKDNRIPLAAKKAIALLVVKQEQEKELEKLKKEYTDKDQFLIIKENDSYKLCRYQEEKDRTPVWHVIAGGISNLRDARLMSLPVKLQKMLFQLSDEVIDDLMSRTEGTDYESYLKEQQENIISFDNYVNHPDKYFVSLDDLLPTESNNEQSSA